MSHLIQDPLIAQAIHNELSRQHNCLELIASENFVSPAVLEAQGSIMTNKYAEGYPGRRYYDGCEFVDEVERLAIERLKQLFQCEYANVQPHSGASANLAVQYAVMQPGDTLMGMSLSAGGHLTHGAPVTLSGKWFKAVSYEVDPQTYLIDYDDVRKRAHAARPKMIIAGGSAYSRVIDFKRFREIADEVDAVLWVDMAHYAGLIAGGVYPSPLPYAHVVSSTTHKTLRGPRGGVIVAQDSTWAQKLNSAVFPGCQGGPLMHVIAAKAVAFGEALQPSFRVYAQQVLDNARALAETLMANGIPVLTGGTDSHMILVDLRPLGISGAPATTALEHAGITCNKNGIPFDVAPPTNPSGIRFGTPALTTRGLDENACRLVGEWISQVLRSSEQERSSVVANIRKLIHNMCRDFPLPYRKDMPSAA